MFSGNKVKARVSKTNRFREVTLRRDAEMNEVALYGETPAYIHIEVKTVSGLVRETRVNRWVFVPTGKYSKILYS